MYFTVRSRLLIIRVARTVKAEAALSARGLARIPLPLLLKNCHWSVHTHRTEERSALTLRQVSQSKSLVRTDFNMSFSLSFSWPTLLYANILVYSLKRGQKMFNYKYSKPLIALVMVTNYFFLFPFFARFCSDNLTDLP